LLLRIKRHHGENRISTYPTQTALAFYIQGPPTLDGLELVTLAAGYRWDTELRRIEAPVISYRDGKDNPIWAVELDEPREGTSAIGWTPIIPSLPGVEFGDPDEADDTGTTDGP
jgi:hypothetical protein